MLKIMDGKPSAQRTDKIGEEIGKIIIELLWEDIAPEKMKANEELRHKFVVADEQGDGREAE